jgi:PEGA domain.
MAMATEFAADVLDYSTKESVEPLRNPDAKWTRPARAGWAVAAAFALIATAEATWIGRLEFARAAASPAAPVPIVFDSLQEGDAVIVDGREVGATPLTLALTPSMRSIRVRNHPAVDTASAATVPAVERPAANAATAMLAQAASRDKRGGLRLSSPIELQVLEGERVLGSSVDGPVVTTADGTSWISSTARSAIGRIRSWTSKRANRPDEDLAAGRPRQRERGAVGSGVNRRECGRRDAARESAAGSRRA